MSRVWGSGFDLGLMDWFVLLLCLFFAIIMVITILPPLKRVSCGQLFDTDGSSNIAYIYSPYEVTYRLFDV